MTKVRVYSNGVELPIVDDAIKIDGRLVSIFISKGDTIPEPTDGYEDCRYKKNCKVYHRVRQNSEDGEDIHDFIYYVRYSGLFVRLEFSTDESKVKDLLDEVFSLSFEVEFKWVTWNGLRIRLDRKYYCISPKQLTLWDDDSVTIYTQDIENLKMFAGEITPVDNGFYKLEGYK